MKKYKHKMLYVCEGNQLMRYPEGDKNIEALIGFIAEDEHGRALKISPEARDEHVAIRFYKKRWLSY